MVRTLYFGQPKGVYSPASFPLFIRGKVSTRLKEIGSESEFNVEEIAENNVTYHFPHAGIGLSYQLINPNRCLVSLMGTKRKEIDDITSFIFKEDK